MKHRAGLIEAVNSILFFLAVRMPSDWHCVYWSAVCWQAQIGERLPAARRRQGAAGSFSVAGAAGLPWRL